jgi:hypothetical protein
MEFEEEFEEELNQLKVIQKQTLQKYIALASQYKTLDRILGNFSRNPTDLCQTESKSSRRIFPHESSSKQAKISSNESKCTIRRKSTV